MARIRTFIAVDLGDAVRRRAAALQEKLSRSAAGVKWVEEHNLHITLLFLGEVEQLDLAPICRIVSEAAHSLPPFTLEIAGLGAFPTPRRPKTLWAGVTTGAAEMKQVHARLEEPLLQLGGYRREGRAFSPHLTLGRVTREDRGGDWGPILARHADWQGGTTTIDEILVMSSELRRDGPVYSVMGRGKFQGAA